MGEDVHCLDMYNYLASLLQEAWNALGQKRLLKIAKYGQLSGSHDVQVNVTGGGPSRSLTSKNAELWNWQREIDMGESSTSSTNQKSEYMCLLQHHHLGEFES
jgi:hypothetical protein